MRSRSDARQRAGHEAARARRVERLRDALEQRLVEHDLARRRAPCVSTDERHLDPAARQPLLQQRPDARLERRQRLRRLDLRCRETGGSPT